MNVSTEQEGKHRKVRMSLDMVDLHQLLAGYSVCYEQKRIFSSLEVNVDLAEVTQEELLQFQSRKETKMSKPVDKQEETCLSKAVARGDSCFTLVEQDLSSPRVICEWIKENIETAPLEKLQNALLRAFYMAHSGKPRKHAD